MDVVLFMLYMLIFKNKKKSRDILTNGQQEKIYYPTYIHTKKNTYECVKIISH